MEIPHQFIAETKAKAEEVNENFQAVKESINEVLMLNNLTNEGKAKFDSQWVNISDGTVFLNRTLSTSETPVEFTLDFLPDNASYELYLTINVYPINTSNNYYGGLIISSDIITTPISLTYSGLPGNYSIGSKSNIYVKNKKLYLSGKSYFSNAKGSLAAVAYRKLGTGFE